MFNAVSVSRTVRPATAYVRCWKHCVWLTILLDSDWVQCSSQQVIHCHHHIWEKECRQRAGSAADKLYQSVEAHLHVAESWSQKEININDKDKASAAWEVMLSNLSLWRHAQFILCCGTLSLFAHYTCSYWHFQNNLSALKHIVITSAESVKKKMTTNQPHHRRALFASLTLFFDLVDSYPLSP
jgi:hypothetical protein